MKENKLIAEFMGISIGEYTTYPEESTTQYAVEDTHYHTSWNWLMPVIEKIKILVMEDDSDELYNSEEKVWDKISEALAWDNITHTLVQIEIKSVYQAVVEFIKEYNLNN